MAADKAARQWDDKEDEEEARGGGVSSGQRLGSCELLFELRKGVLARASWIDSPNPMLLYCCLLPRDDEIERSRDFIIIIIIWKVFDNF